MRLTFQFPQTGQQQRPDVSQMMGLVGQRRQLVAELEDLQERRADVQLKMKSATSGELASLRQLEGEISGQIRGATNAMNGIDRMIAIASGTPVPPAPAAPPAPPAAPAIAPGFQYETQPAPGRDVSFSAKDSAVFAVGLTAVLALVALAGLNYVRRIRRDTNTAVNQLRSEIWDEMRKVSLGVETMAVEIERIGEGQRFVTKALSDKKDPIPRS